MPVLLGLPELLPLIIGLFALLLYLAFDALKRLLSAVFNDWGGIVRLVGGAIDGALDSAFNAVKGWLLAALHPVLGLFSHPSAALDSHTKANVSAHVHHQQVSQFIAGTLVPDVTTSILTEAKAAVSDLRSYLDDAVVPSIAATEQALQGELNQDAAALQSVEIQVARLSDTVFGQNLLAQIQGVAQVVGTVQSQLAQAYRDLEAQQGQITSTAELAAAAPGYTDTQVAQGVTAAEEQSARYTDALGADALSGLREGNPALPAALAAALSTVAAQAAAATSYVDECGGPMCDWWKPLQGDLNNLFTDLGIAGLMALIAEAADNPTAAAHDFSAGAGLLRDAGLAIISPFVSVPTGG